MAVADEPLNEVNDAEVTEFCAAVGELILWASMIDSQLNEALVSAMALPEHKMVQPIVAQLDARPKAELLKRYARFITNPAWKKGIINWVERAEKVNGNRNYVAHHSIHVDDGSIVFFSQQLGKMLKNMTRKGDTIEVTKGKGVSDVQDWIIEAKKVHTEGRNVLENLRKFREKANTSPA